MAHERTESVLRAHLALVAATAVAGSSVALAEEAGREDTLAACQDSADNDGDGRVDCWDEDCRSFTVCARPGASYERREDTIAACGDRVDNDGDGFTDCDDQDCRPWRICSGGAPPAAPAESGPTPEDTNEACQDGRDNDGDGFTDCDDQDCEVWVHCAAGTAPPTPPEPPPVEPPPAPTTGRLRVDCATAGATVIVDGVARGSAPIEGELPAGEHTVRVEAEGYIPSERTVTVTAGTGVTQVSVGLRPEPTTPDPTGPETPPDPGEPEEQEPIGWFALGFGVQIPFLTMGEGYSVSTAGASFVVRPTVAVVRSPIAFELGLQLAAGYLADSAYPAIYRANVEHTTSDTLAFYDAKYFQVGLYLGLTIPVWTVDRPIVALTMGITNGITAYPAQYFLHAAAGLSWFATRLVELRLELVGIELRRVEALMTPDTPLGVRELKDIWIFHFAPTLLVNLRF